MGFEEKKQKQTGGKPDRRIETVLIERATDGELPCAVAFDAAKALETTPEVIGEYADRLKLRLVKCQLGLFGYLPEKKIVSSAESVPPELSDAIQAGLRDGRLPCKTAWEIAKKFNIGKMQVSAACETLGIKVKPCQLGAF